MTTPKHPKGRKPRTSYRMANGALLTFGPELQELDYQSSDVLTMAAELGRAFALAELGVPPDVLSGAPSSSSYAAIKERVEQATPGGYRPPWVAEPAPKKPQRR